jgi:hypothetical protein
MRGKMAVERPRLFERLKKGLKEGIAHQRGERTLRQTVVVVPDAPPRPDGRTANRD